MVLGLNMDLATVLLLHKSSLLVGAMCFAYVCWRSREPGLDLLAIGFSLLALGSTLAGWGEQGMLPATLWRMGSFAVGAMGHALMAVGLIQLSRHGRCKADWIAVAVVVALVLFIWRMGWYDTNWVRAALFNLAEVCFLSAASVSIGRGYLKDRLSARFWLLGTLLASIFLAFLVILDMTMPQMMAGLSILEPSLFFFMQIICQFTIALFAVVLVQERAEANLRLQAGTDALTGVPNRQHFLAALPRKLQPGDAFVMLDIDHFKSINDRFGHEAGDDVLTGVAQAIAAAAGPGTLLGRLGGEEFGLFLSGQTQETALAGAENIRLAVKSLSFIAGAAPLSTSASLGVAVWSGTEDARTLRDMADQALYLAKHSGRDKVVLYTAA